jgi:CheY-like chemotaxis protein
MSRFDIFKEQPDGSLRWLAAAATMETAEACVKGLPPGTYVISDQRTARKISIQSPAKQIVFQISYDDDKGAAARETLFRSFGHEVVSAGDNGAAKRALAAISNVDVFILGHMAPEQTRQEMVDWLRANFPKARIVALIPSSIPELLCADYNVPQSDWAAWVSLFATS